mgnify:FL=1
MSNEITTRRHVPDFTYILHKNTTKVYISIMNIEYDYLATRC